MRNDLPQSRRVLQRVVHGPRSVSLTIDYTCDFAPGQFVMAWLPGVDEKPFSVSRHQPDTIEITVKRLGDVSSRIADLDVGDLLGIRGPYGHPFTPTENCILIAGGVGLAAVAPLIEQFPQAIVLYGENNSDERLYSDRFEHSRFYTVDGSSGLAGFPTDDLPALLAERKPDIVQTCGPEVMMTKVAQACVEAGVACELSLERYMKCAIGVCGQCCMDGQRVCVDGPVFTAETLLNAKDFGFRKLDKSGAWVSFGHE